MKTIADLHADDSGAAFIEYTALLGVILAVGLLVLLAVAGWANQVWSALCSNLGAATTGVGAVCNSP